MLFLSFLDYLLITSAYCMIFNQDSIYFALSKIMEEYNNPVTLSWTVFKLSFLVSSLSYNSYKPTLYLSLVLCPNLFSLNDPQWFVYFNSISSMKMSNYHKFCFLRIGT